MSKSIQVVTLVSETNWSREDFNFWDAQVSLDEQGELECNEGACRPDVMRAGRNVAAQLFTPSACMYFALELKWCVAVQCCD